VSKEIEIETKIEVEITGCKIRTLGRVVHNLPVILPLLAPCPVGSMESSDFHLLYQILGSHSVVPRDSGLLGYDTIM
jgi:hypothetical protein